MRIVWLLAYSLACAILLTLFSNIQDMFKYVFSLGALFLGIRFFRQFEELRYRIWFFVIAVFFYFVFNVIYALYRAGISGEFAAYL